MWIVKACDKEGFAVAQRNAYGEKDIEFLKSNFAVMYPGRNIVVEEYVPRTKEVAEQEIKEKLAKQKKPKKTKE